MKAPAPNPTLIPDTDILGVTVVLLTCSYMDKEFVRVGYYVNNEYLEEELKENPPLKPQFDKLHRSILADKPRVTRFTVPWDTNTAAEMQAQMEQQQTMAGVGSGGMAGGEGSLPQPAMMMDV